MSLRCVVCTYALRFFWPAACLKITHVKTNRMNNIRCPSTCQQPKIWPTRRLSRKKCLPAARLWETSMGITPENQTAQNGNPYHLHTCECSSAEGHPIAGPICQADDECTEWQSCTHCATKSGRCTAVVDEGNGYTTFTRGAFVVNHQKEANSINERLKAASIPWPALASSEPWPLDQAEVLYIPSILSANQSRMLMGNFQQPGMWGPGSEAVLEDDHKRQTLSFSDPPGMNYVYSGRNHYATAFPDFMLEAKHELERKLGPALQEWAANNSHKPSFNFCLVNYYSNGHAEIPYHSDDEPHIIKGSPIAGLSLGDARVFALTKTGDKSIRVHRRLDDGSVVLMYSKTQKLFKHSVVQQTGWPGPRISLTFRMITNEATRYNTALLRHGCSMAK